MDGMDYIANLQKLDLCQAFFDAYVAFCVDGTEAHWFVCNDRNIEISFSDSIGCLSVRLYCPEILRKLSSRFDKSAVQTDKIITKIHWLAWEAEPPSVYRIDTADSDKEYDQIKLILIDRYRRCYYTYCSGDYWKGDGEERFIIQLHNKQIKVSFYTNAMWDANGYIDANLFCLETGDCFSTVVHQEEENPEEIIRAIQRMSWEIK